MKKFAFFGLLLLAATALPAQDLTKPLLEAMALFQGGNYNAAIGLLAPLDRPENMDNPLYPTLLQALGLSAYSMGNYTLAIESLEKLKGIQERTLGREDPSYTATLNYLGDLYRIIGNYALAIDSLEKLKDIQGRTLGREDSDYAATLNNLGLLYQAMGNHTQAETYYLEAKAIREKALGREHPDYATTLNNLGGLYYTIGDYAWAGIHYLEAKAIREKALGKEHPNYAQTLNNLGALYYATGDYAQAENYHLEAKAIQEKVLGREHPDYATTLNGLGALYWAIRDHVRAESSLQEAKAIQERTLGRKHPNYATTLNNLGGLYHSMGDYARALSCYLEAKSIQEKILGREHSSYVLALNNLGGLYWAMGDYAQVESYWLEAKAIWGKALGREHPTYAMILDNLGSLYRVIGGHAQAESCYLEAKAIREKVLGREHPNYAGSTSNLSSLYQDMGNYPRALELKEENSRLRINTVNRNFAFFSARQRGLYWDSVSFDFVHSYSLSHFQSGPAANSLNYNNTLFSKGLLLRTSNAVRDAIYSSGAPSLIAQYEELGGLRRRIQNLRSSGGSEEYIQELETQAEELDKSLSRDSAEYRNLKADLSMTWREVQAALGEDEAAIEFVAFQVYDKKWTDKTVYAALVLRPGMEAPLWTALCNESQITEQLSRVQGRTSSEQARILYDIFGQQLYDLVWGPLEGELEGVKRIYYSPSGLLHKISFAALPWGEGERLADKYDLNLVSSTREAAERGEAGGLDRAVVYGGLKYGGDTEEDRAEMAAAAREYREMAVLAERERLDSVVVVSRGPPGERTRGGAWGELEASGGESLMVDGYLGERGIGRTLYQGVKGNEESFKGLDGKKTALIHVATHGYFLEDIREDEGSRELVERLGGGRRGLEDPLLRSGLILAGGNHAWTKKPVEGEELEDGILTAAEVAELNLVGTELVVLSACETGLGEVNNGEGVFGLQRAFKLAGVKTLVMSLWEVADGATGKLMEIFYRRWLGGEGKGEAFKGAQRELREQYPEPYYWAAFVMMD
jgi:CHAT domain-containing protein/Flp pilus assembly protein TadD